MSDKPDGSLQALVMLICLMWPISIPIILAIVFAFLALCYRLAYVVFGALARLIQGLWT